MRNSTSQRHAWGICVGSMHWSAFGLPLDRMLAPIAKHKTDKHVPASVLLSRITGEPARLDYWSPPHPRGSANAWPPEAMVSHKTGGGRFPLAAAWTGRVEDRSWPWQIDGDQRVLSSLDAITSGATQLAKIHARSSPSAIVIPNDFRQREQQRLLDVCSATSVNASLLWLPVAAALAWLDSHHESLPSPRVDSSDRLMLPIVHADWGRIRCSTLYLVARQDEGGSRWMPARRRPAVSDWNISGFGWKECAGCHQLNVAAMWQKHFISAKSREEQRSSNFDSNVLEQVARWPVEQSTSREVDLALAEHLSRIQVPTAIIFVGDFAPQVADGPAVSRSLSLASNFRAPIASVIADGVSGEDMLAKGASIFARDRIEGRTSYLDTLPDLELFVDRNYRYDWLSLLGDTDQFVAGGQQWELPKPIDGLVLRRGATSIKLVVAHDEYEGVRELQVSLDRPAERDLGAQLHVSATPAQGNARLRLVTEAFGDISSRSILANWDRMEPLFDKLGAPIDKEAYTQSRPRAFPNLRPRPADTNRWGTFNHRARKFLAEVLSASDINKKSAALGRLLDASRIASGCSAISSEGNVPPGEDQSIVDSLAILLFDYVNKFTDTLHRRTHDQAAKLLAFMSVDCAGLDPWIRGRIDDSPSLDETTCIIAGNSIRNPATASFFVHKLLNAIPFGNKKRLLNYQMQALGRLLSQRQDVLSELDEAEAYLLVEECLKVFSDETERDNLAWLFEHSGLVVVYALRYRIYDPAFLDPESELAIRAKSQFEVAIEKLTERHNRRVSRFRYGNFVSPSRATRLMGALQQLIDYIDKRGEGDILIALED